MILSHFLTRELSRLLSVSKLWNKTILDSVELRRTLFLAPQHTKDSAGYLEFMEGRDPRCYEIPSMLQPVILPEPLVVRKPDQIPARLLVKPHPVLLNGVGQPGVGRVSDIMITLSNFETIKTAPASALLFQPPLEHVVIDHWGRCSSLEIPEGVTFGAVLEAIGNMRAANMEVIVRSPRFAKHLYGRENQEAVCIRAKGAMVYDDYDVQVARLASAKTKELAALDESSRVLLE